ncbi:hypothetical protein TNCT_179351 [Trichonephila clavata]|uniref:Uncharacterized protein n=1 Tax=Trichonephila clavata TaxID=2740835 RepID=A0A8X6GP16_TRICU|nr:hypothetical protein TNCT_179351 [Trichonephila clavata]
MARLRTAETLQEQGTRRKFNSLQMMQTRISETAQNREVRFERQRNVHAVFEWLFGKTKKMLPTSTTQCVMYSWTHVNYLPILQCNEI